MYPAQHYELWRLAGPMILSNISVALLGMVDTAVMGHLAAPFYVGAVAVGAVIFSFLYWGLGFLRMGTTGQVSQAFGAGNPDQAAGTLVQALLLALVLALVLLLCQGPLVRLGLPLLEGSSAVQAHAALYCHTKIWGAPAALGMLVIIGGLVGLHNTRATLLLLTLVHVLNITLDLIFVVVFEWHVVGVAAASVVAEYTGLFVGLALLLRQLGGIERRVLRRALLDSAGFRAMLSLNHSIFLRTLCLIATFAFFTRQGARQGDVILAANAVLLNFQNLMALGLDGVAIAVEAMVGRAVGRQARQELLDCIRVGALWCAVLAVLFAAAFMAAGGVLIDLLTGLPEVRLEARRYLPWIIASPLISMWCFALDGIFIGLTRGREMRNSMLLCTFGVFLPAWWLLRPWDNHGLWAAFLVFMAARGITLGASLLRIDARGQLMAMRQ